MFLNNDVNSDGHDVYDWFIAAKQAQICPNLSATLWRCLPVSFDFFLRQESVCSNRSFKSGAVILIHGIVCPGLRMTDNLVVSVPPEHDTCTAESPPHTPEPPHPHPSPLLSVSLSLAVVGHQSFVVETMVAAIKDAR